MGETYHRLKEIEMTQSNLFSAPVVRPNKKAIVKPNQKKIHWSYTRRHMLITCPRKYFYYYYASNPKSNYIHKTLAYRYKMISNKHTVFGEIIHWVISCALRAAQKGKEEWDEERMISFGKKMIEDAIADSVNLKKGKEPVHDKVFMELYFEEQSSQDILEEGLSKVENCIENLFDYPEFIKVYEAGKIEDSEVERSTRFGLNDHITVNGQLDMGYYDQHSFKIVDWKTGQNHIEDTSLQLSVYGIWANHALKIPAANIEISKAYLEEREVDSFTFNDMELERARTRIRQDYEIMNQLESFAHDGEIEAFDACGKRSVCENCSFKRICYHD